VDRRTVALGLAAAGAVAAAVIVTLTNHSQGPSKQRSSITAYITSVNEAQERMRGPLTRVLLAYRDFTRPSAKHRDSAGELTRAEATLRKLGSRIAAIAPPPEAKRLRMRLMELIAAEQMVTREVRELAVFAPRYSALLAQARRAGATLGAALANTKIPQPHPLRGTVARITAAQHAYEAEAAGAANQQADAIAAYDAALSVVVAHLRSLQPPPAFTPGFRAQLRAFRVSAGAGDELAAELRKSDRSHVAVAGQRFTSSARIAESLAAQKAEIVAIKGYNRRAREISAAAGNVQNEVARLNRTLP
jgi:hypothetical protein